MRATNCRTVLTQSAAHVALAVDVQEQDFDFQHILAGKVQSGQQQLEVERQVVHVGSGKMKNFSVIN